MLYDGNSIVISDVSRVFDQTRALDNVSVSLSRGDFSVLLGPSGCGKSTLLRLIAGLDEQTDGTIRIEGQDMQGKPPSARNLSMVFQSYALFPHLNVAENILFGLSVRKTPKPERIQRLDRVAEMMGLDQLLQRRPSQLSGGQQQRVALARAVISERPICLMDEPLSNLDAKLRAEMRVELRELQKKLGLSVVYVTHDQVEAMTMADKIIIMNAGKIEQVGTPEQIYTHPETVFTAGFIGTPPMNLFPAGTLFSDVSGAVSALSNTVVGIRPEDLFISDDGPQAELLSVEFLGADRLVTGHIAGSKFIMRLTGQARIPAEKFGLGWSVSALSAFQAQSGKRLHDFDFSTLSQTQKDLNNETA